MGRTMEMQRKLHDHVCVCVCVCVWGGGGGGGGGGGVEGLLLLGIRQTKQNIPSHLAISSWEDIIHNTLIWLFLNKMWNIF